MSGKLCIVGYHQGEPRRIPLGHWNWMAFEILNAHFRDTATIMRGMRAGMRLVSAGLLDASGLVTDTYPLSRVAEALRSASFPPAKVPTALATPKISRKMLTAPTGTPATFSINGVR